MRISIMVLIAVLSWVFPALAQGHIVASNHPEFIRYDVSGKHLATASAFNFIDDINKAEEFQRFLHKAKEKASKYPNEKAFGKYLFYKVHRKLLLKYRTPATVESLFADGTYDCLTATALFSYIFTELGFDHHIVETSYHIYLMLEVDGKQVMIESTNPLGGYISNAETIANLQQEITDTESITLQENSNPLHYRLKAPVHNEIGFNELKGLYYYNLALDFYNHQKLSMALPLMELGLRWYPSPRLMEVYQVMINTLLSDPMANPWLKSRYISQSEATTSAVTALSLQN